MSITWELPEAVSFALQGYPLISLKLSPNVKKNNGFFPDVQLLLDTDLTNTNAEVRNYCISRYVLEHMKKEKIILRKLFVSEVHSKSKPSKNKFLLSISSSGYRQRLLEGIVKLLVAFLCVVCLWLSICSDQLFFPNRCPSDALLSVFFSYLLGLKWSALIC